MDKILKAAVILASAGHDGIGWDDIERQGYNRSEWANVIMPALALAGYEYVGGGRRVAPYGRTRLLLRSEAHMKLDQARDFWRSRGVPEAALDDLWFMAEAARYNDADVEEHGEGGVRRLLLELGFQHEAVDYMAEQRGMRVLMALGPAGATALREFARKMNPAVIRNLPQPALVAVTLAWTDGFATCARAIGLREGFRPDGFETPGKGA